MHTFYKEVGGFQGSKANMMYECESTLKVCIRYYYCFLLFCFVFTTTQQTSVLLPMAYLMAAGKNSCSFCPDERYQPSKPQSSLIKWIKVQRWSKSVHIKTFSNRLLQADLECPVVCYNPTLRRNALRLVFLAAVMKFVLLSIHLCIRSSLGTRAGLCSVTGGC